MRIARAGAGRTTPKSAGLGSSDTDYSGKPTRHFLPASTESPLHLAFTFSPQAGEHMGGDRAMKAKALKQHHFEATVHQRYGEDSYPEHLDGY
ncbi:hypothetical protein NUU61_005566 [Penicillium alfredii]|uniref:Uncharacterized protein n=1 Tax=Penicillium alfredii TaxID=1506179 RepID=A0A9W9K7Y8_9EURO|nr:uncharacterized protein NUU61_005566 [Penicillium alfredii]KAJ5096210.1 hypothetical protein NUU61_005566 [Penicillium alfredii]